MIPSDRAHRALISAVACCLAGLAAPAATAEGADDLECRKCVDQTDIAPRAVTPGKIRNGAVHERKLGRDVRDRLETIESRFEFVAVAGAAFQPSTAEVMTEKTPAGVIQPLQTDDLMVVAGATLPHGILLKDMACTVRDATDPGLVTVTLRRFPLDAVAPETGSDPVIRVSSAAVVPLTDQADPNDYRRIFSIAQDLGFSVVDNENYQYFLEARMTDIGDDPSAMALAGCRIRLDKDPL